MEGESAVIILGSLGEVCRCSKGCAMFPARDSKIHSSLGVIACWIDVSRHLSTEVKLFFALLEYFGMLECVVLFSRPQTYF